MSSTRQQRQRSASPAPPGESDSNINVTQRGEFTYLEIKKMYSCPAKCGTESNDKSHMLRHIWVDHREEDGLNLMKQFQIDSGEAKNTQSNLLRKQRLDFAGPEKIAQAKLKHEQAAQHEQYRLEQYQALSLAPLLAHLLHLLRHPHPHPHLLHPLPRPSSATPLAKNYTLSRCWVQGVFQTHEDLEAHLSTHHHPAPPSSPK
ncbi:unnamed protein product [Aureobasidium pullulans]|nr:unnamed protein product [Aureobasidium pullulans]